MWSAAFRVLRGRHCHQQELRTRIAVDSTKIALRIQVHARRLIVFAATGLNVASLSASKRWMRRVMGRELVSSGCSCQGLMDILDKIRKRALIGGAVCIPREMQADIRALGGLT